MSARDKSKQYTLLSQKGLGSMNKRRRSIGWENKPNLVFMVAAFSMVAIYFAISFLTGL